MAKTFTPREFGMPAGFRLLPNIDPTGQPWDLNGKGDPVVVCLGVGRKLNGYRLEDKHGKFHYVDARNFAAAKAVLATINR